MYNINKERLINRFMEMVQISSESLNEKEFGDYCKTFLEKIGCDIIEDRAKLDINNNQSNIIGKYYGNEIKQTLMFCAHLDTVKPGENIKPIRENGIIKSNGNTILGADDKSGIAALFEALLYIKENDLDVPNIDIVLTVSEEIGLLGAKNLDFSILRAKEGYALDSESIEGIFIKAPSQNTITITINGLESHAGMFPEKGISSIKVAAEAIVNMSLGRINSQTTANMGIIKGGVATNIIPKQTIIKGEVRSHSEEELKYYTDKIIEAVYNACENNKITLNNKEIKSNADIEVIREYDSMHVKEEENVVKRAIEVYKKLNIKYKLLSGGGGSDANIFNKNGIKTIILGTGMSEVHTVNEYIKEEDLVKITQIIIGLLSE